MSYFPTWRVKRPVPGMVVAPDERLPWPQTAAMGVQHVIAMFGASTVAPLLMGFDPNVAILMSGVGTLIFFVTVGGRVPSYLGSSFAFIGVVIAASGYGGSGPNTNLGVALGGIVVCGAIYTVIGVVVALTNERSTRSTAILGLAHGLLGGAAFALGAHRTEDRSGADEHRLQVFGQRLVVATGTVGQAQHAEHVAAVEQRHTKKRVQRRLARRQAAAARVGRGVVADDDLSAHDRHPEQVVEVVKLERFLRPAARMPLDQRAGGAVPGDVGQHLDAQEGRALCVVQHVGQEAVFAAGALQQVGQQRLEDLARRRGCSATAPGR